VEKNVPGGSITPRTLTAASIPGWMLPLHAKSNLWRACNLTAFTHSSTGPVVHLFASRHKGPGFIPQGGTVPDHEKPGSRCHLSKAHNSPGMLGIWNGEGMGRGRSVYE
jgi:hypothetical protein